MSGIPGKEVSGLFFMRPLFLKYTFKLLNSNGRKEMFVVLPENLWQ